MAITTLHGPAPVATRGLARARRLLQLIPPGGQADIQTENFWKSLPKSPTDSHHSHISLEGPCPLQEPGRARVTTVDWLNDGSHRDGV